MSQEVQIIATRSITWSTPAQPNGPKHHCETSATMARMIAARILARVSFRAPMILNEAGTSFTLTPYRGCAQSFWQACVRKVPVRKDQNFLCANIEQSYFW